MARPRNTSPTRKCKKCGETKAAAEFPQRRNTCKPCYSQQKSALARRKRQYAFIAERWEAAQARWLAKTLKEVS